MPGQPTSEAPDVAPAYATTLADPSDNASWDAARAALNARLARSILELWTTIAACGQSGLLGRNGALFGHEIHPKMTGRR